MTRQLRDCKIEQQHQRIQHKLRWMQCQSSPSKSIILLLKIVNDNQRWFLKSGSLKRS